MHLFRESGLDIKGKVLTKEEYRPFLGFEHTTLNPERMTEYIARAEKYLEEPLLALPVCRFRDFVVNGNRSEYEKHYFARRTRMMTLGFAEMAEKKGRFLEAFIDTVWAVLEETTWLLPAHNKHNPTSNDGMPSTWGGRKHGVALFGASTGADLAFLYTNLKDEMDAYAPEVGKRLVYEVHERCIRPFLEIEYYWSGEGGGHPNNWNPWIISEVLFTTALLSEDLEEREAVLARASRFIDNFVDGYGIDGGCDEGPGYWAGAGLAYITYLCILYDMTGGTIDLLSHPLVKKMGEYVCKVHIAGKYFINNADCSLRPGVSGEALLFVGERVKSDMMLEMGYAIEGETPFLYNTGIVNPYRIYLALCRPLTSGKVDIHSPLTVYFRDLKIALMRENTNAMEGLCFALKGGHNSESHNHNDVGQFFLYHNATPVIVDMGGMTYTRKTFSPERYTIMAMRSLYHSTITPLGMEQLPGVEYASSEEVFDEVGRTVSMNIKNAYPAGSGILNLTRKVTLADGTVTLTDTVAYAEEGALDIHFLTPDAPTVNPDGTLTLPSGVTLAYPDTLTYRLEPIDITIDKNLSAGWKREALYMMHFEANVKEGAFTFRFCK